MASIQPSADCLLALDFTGPSRCMSEVLCVLQRASLLRVADRSIVVGAILINCCPRERSLQRRVRSPSRSPAPCRHCRRHQRRPRHNSPSPRVEGSGNILALPRLYLADRSCNHLDRARRDDSADSRSPRQRHRRTLDEHPRDPAADDGRRPRDTAAGRNENDDLLRRENDELRRRQNDDRRRRVEAMEGMLRQVPNPA